MGTHMVMESLTGESVNSTGKSTLVIGVTIKNRVKAYTNMQMAESMTGSGELTSTMELER